MWEQHLQNRDIGLEVSRAGFDPARPSLLMVHGAGGCGQSFLSQLSGLGRDVNAAAIDLPGHGNTPGPGMASVDDYADWLAGFLAAGPIKPVLMGHSMGGAIVQTLARRHPRLARGLILVGTGARLRVLPAILEGISKDYPATLRLIVKSAYAPQAAERALALGIEQMSQTQPQVLLGDFSACNLFDTMASLGEIKHPALVVCGQDDRLTPPKYSHYLAEKLPRAELEIIPGAGHMVFVEQMKAFNQRVLEFMSSF